MKYFLFIPLFLVFFPFQSFALCEYDNKVYSLRSEIAVYASGAEEYYYEMYKEQRELGHAKEDVFRTLDYMGDGMVHVLICLQTYSQNRASFWVFLRPEFWSSASMANIKLTPENVAWVHDKSSDGDSINVTSLRRYVEYKGYTFF